MPENLTREEKIWAILPSVIRKPDDEVWLLMTEKEQYKLAALKVAIIGWNSFEAYLAYHEEMIQKYSTKIK